MYSFFLFTAVILFFAGIVYRCSVWFPRQSLVRSPEKRDLFYSDIKKQKIFYPESIFNGIFFSLRFLANIFLQLEILKKNLLHWFVHMLIFWGFMGLVVMHAFAPFTSEKWFADYYSTLMPYMFVRNLFGFMVILGVTGAFIRRRLDRIVKPLTTRQDLFVLVIILAMILSGNLLEAVKITSETEFEDMTIDWAGIEDTEDMLPLKVYWSAEFGLVCQDPSIKNQLELMDDGREQHLESCSECHSKPQWAFVSYPIARAMSPVGIFWGRVNQTGFFWIVHVGLCLIGLAYLPFGKMFHVISSPVHFGFDNRMKTLQAPMMNHFNSPWQVALDACVNCATCSVNCSVAPLYDVYGNKQVLPSERMKTIRKWIHRSTVEKNVLMELRQGNALCTGCNRCSDVCPSGIDTLAISKHFCETILDQQNIQLPERQVQHHLEESDTYFQGGNDSLRVTILKSTRQDVDAPEVKDNVSVCYKCKTCTSVCPVVGHVADPSVDLGLAPHQIMHAVSMGLIDMAIHTRMIWDCTTCYACQENCPQGVNITEIIYQLKNQAFKLYGDHLPDNLMVSEISVPAQLNKEVEI